MKNVEDILYIYLTDLSLKKNFLPICIILSRILKNVTIIKLEMNLIFWVNANYLQER